MLLIRPFLRMNRGHIKPFHVVFFIFIVANCGGLLTPIGDPPLFLGYLNGIPFMWTVDHLWPIWLVTVGALLAIFFIIDTLDHRKAERAHEKDPGPQVHVLGIHNFIFISVVIFAVFRPGIFEVFHHISSEGANIANVIGVLLSREILMTAAMVASRLSTSREIYTHNQFSYAPIREVAILFIGIFSTMAPALGWLSENASKMQVQTPGQYYFTTGGLSSVLDNAPTYLTFLQIRRAELPAEDIELAKANIEEMRASGRLAISPDLPEGNVHRALETLVIDHPDRIRSGTLQESFIRVGFLLGNPNLSICVIAISAAAVLFGAGTYIGNGPNFMVKSIADSSGINTPSFLGYIMKYSLPILLPLYILVWAIFLR